MEKPVTRNDRQHNRWCGIRGDELLECLLMDDENAREGLKDLRWCQRDKGGRGILLFLLNPYAPVHGTLYIFPRMGGQGG